MGDPCPAQEGLCADVASNAVLTKFREVARSENINCDFCCRNSFKAKAEMKAGTACSWAAGEGLLLIFLLEVGRGPYSVGKEKEVFDLAKAEVSLTES